MTSKELNLKLITHLPELDYNYHQETSWQDGDETGSHVVYADVLVPFIKEQMLSENKAYLTKIFEYIEILLETEDEYASEVVSLSVLESLLFDEEVNNSLLLSFAKPKTIQLVNEIVQSI